MASQETERLFCFRLLGDATRKDKQDFFLFRINTYHAKTQWCDSNLSEYFAGDIRSFTAEDFKNVVSDSRRTLRDLMYERGVYFQKGRNVFISDALHAAEKKELDWFLEAENEV